MTAITDLAGRAAPGPAASAKGRPAGDAAERDGTASESGFAALVNQAQAGSAAPGKPAGDRGQTENATGATTLPAGMPAASSLLAGDALLTGAGAEATVRPVATTPGQIAGEPDPASGTISPSRGRRGRLLPAGSPSEDAASMGKVGRALPSADPIALQDAGKDQPATDDPGLAAADGQTLTALTSGADVAPAQTAADAGLAAASSLVALVAAQQAATPALDPRSPRAERVVTQIGGTGASSVLPLSLAAAPDLKAEPAATDRTATATSPVPPVAEPPPVAVAPADAPADLPSLAGIRATPKRAEAMAVDTPVAAAPPRLFAMPASVGAAEALGDATIDMSVGGQWIDRMAREITRLADGSGQSRFHLLPPQLGRIQVEVTIGDAGTMVRMTTETDEAADRLRAGSTQLQADARMASLPLAGLVIDRASAGGFDTSRDNGQNHAQPQAGSRASADQSGQAGGQSSGQSSASSSEQRHKAADREAVLKDRSESEASTRAAPANDRRIRFA